MYATLMRRSFKSLQSTVRALGYEGTRLYMLPLHLQKHVMARILTEDVNPKYLKDKNLMWKQVV